MAGEANTTCSERTEDWSTLPWKDIQQNVFRLQRRNLRERYAFLGREPERCQARPRPTTVAATLPSTLLRTGFGRHAV
jgi:hypothetical protein